MMISFLPPRSLIALGLLLLAAPARAAEVEIPAISPDPTAISVRSGEVAATPLTLSNPASQPLDWRLEALDANGRPATLEGQLDAITASGDALNGPLPSRLDFTGGDAGTTSLSGNPTGTVGLLNQGNRLLTNLGGPLAYTETSVLSSAALGPGGRYFTRKLPGLFVFAAEADGIHWFEVAGTFNSPTTKQARSFRLAHTGDHWSAFVVNQIDPYRTVNHLILVDQGGLQQTLGSGSFQQQRITGLSGKRRIYHFLYVTNTTAVQPLAVFENLAIRFLNLLPWIGPRFSFNPAQGSIPAAGQVSSSVTFDATNLTVGNYQGMAGLASTGGEPLVTVPMSVQVTAPRIEVPGEVTRVMLPGMLAETVQVPIRSNLPDELAWSAAVEAPASWLTLESHQGSTPEDLRLRIDPSGLAVGSHSALVRIISGGATFRLPVSLRIAGLSIRKFLADPLRPVVYAVNQDGKGIGQLIEIDPGSRRILRACEVGEEPSDLDLAENGRQIIVMNTTNPSITRVDLEDFSVKETIPLTEFSNRNNDVGGHVKCGRGDIVYYVDEQWGPRLRVFNTVTRTVLQTFSADSGISPDLSNNNGYGDIGLSPDRSHLFGWRQYGDGAGSAGTHLVRFSVNPDGTLSNFGKSQNYQFPNFTREPFDTPVLFSHDGSRLIIKDREIGQENLDLHRVIYPNGIYSIPPNAGLAISRSAIHSGRGDETLFSLPVTTSIQAISADYSSLVYFNTTSKSIGWVDLRSTPGYARMGLKVKPMDGTNVAEPQRLQWLPQAGVTRYQVFLGTNLETVVNATSDAAEYLGESSGVRFDLKGDLTPGLTYYWRVAPIINGQAGPGEVRSFHFGGMVLSRQDIETIAVRGLASHPESLTLDSDTPIAWTAATQTSWIRSITPAGTTPSTLEIIIDTTGLATGFHNGSVTITSAEGPIAVPINLRVTDLNVVKLLRHPERAVVYGLHQAAVGEGFSQVLEIGAADARIFRASPLGVTAPTDAALDAETGRLFVASAGSAPTRVLDVDAWQALASLDLGDVSRVQIASGGRLVTLGSSNLSDVILWDATTGVKLATLFSSYQGDIKTDAVGEILYTAGSTTNSNLRKYRIAANAFELLINGPSIPLGSRNLILSEDGSRVFWLGRAMDAELNILAHLPSSAEIRAINQSGDLAVTDNSVFWSDSATAVASLPFASTVAAVSADDDHLLRFNATTRTLHSIPVSSLTDLPGPKPRPGQVLAESPGRISWAPVEGAIGYRFHLAESNTALAAMTGPTEVVKSPFFEPAAPLGFGRFHLWRADAVLADGSVVAGSIRSFGIEFPQGPPIAGSGKGLAVSLANRHLLIGLNGSAQLHRFDPESGATTPLQSLTPPVGASTQQFGFAVALDGGRAFVAAPSTPNPESLGGVLFTYRQTESGLWEGGNALLPAPAISQERFGLGLAASGNLMLAGGGGSWNAIGRVGAYLTEPDPGMTQFFSASDGSVSDSFGQGVALQGNHALVSARRSGTQFNRIPALYAFNRSTVTGQWQQSQKIVIPGAIPADWYLHPVISMSGNHMATNVGHIGVVVLSRDRSGQWVHSQTISGTEVAGSSASFGRAVAVVGNDLFIGDPGATQSGTSGGAVYSFRMTGGSWVPGPTLVPQGSRSDFGWSLAVRDRWLLVASGGSRPAWLFRVSDTTNRTPQFASEIPTQLVAGREFSIPIVAEDADGNSGLMISMLQRPSGVVLTDNGGGQARLSGVAPGAVGSVIPMQIRVRDSSGTEVHHAWQFTVVSPTAMPVLGETPTGTHLGVGQELVLRASVSGLGPFKWQWFKDGAAIQNANSNTYLVQESEFSDAGRYFVRVTNVVGAVDSPPVEVSVRPADRYAGDWLTFGGSPTHTGRHPAALAHTQFIPAWNTAVQPGFVLNRAAIADGRAAVVPQSRFANGIAARALDLKSGEVLWSFPLPSSNSTNPPSIHDGRVYFQRGKGTGGSDTPQLFSLDAATGNQLWASTFGAQWESYEAPAVGDAGIFINGGAYGGMYGFNFNGSERFFSSLVQYDRWTPTLANGRLFSWVGEGATAAFSEHNPVDGSVRWSIQPGSGRSPYSMNTVSAVSGNSAVLVTNSELICVDLTSRSIRWRVPVVHGGSAAIGHDRAFAIQGNAVRSYALADGSPDLVYQTDSPTNPSLIDQPILFNDRLVISSELKTWIFNLEDGGLLQALNAGGRLSYSEGYLLAAGNDGSLRAFAALNTNPKLAALELGSGDFLPEFDPLTGRYISTVPFATDTVTITPTTEYPDATVTINGAPTANGAASGPIALAVGENELSIVVTAEDGVTTVAYFIAVTRLPQRFVFGADLDVPITANGFVAGDFPVEIALGYHPVPGTSLVMVRNTGLAFIQGRFGNLAQGQRITLGFEGVDNDFVANYYGGSGNDLVLQWADNVVAAWGLNNHGQLGNGGTVDQAAPVVVDRADGKTVFAVAAGYLYSVALLHDGTLMAWGYNVQGQLGLGHQEPSHVAMAVDAGGALAGKTVVAIAAGAFHNVALCSDGSVVSWGLNNHGQLGTGDRVMRTAPVVVEPVGALAGKRVVAVAVGFYHSLALCDDGSVVGWGYNDEGQLGDGGTTTTLVPVAVDRSGGLAGKNISRIAAGQYHTLALCTDGSLVTWGYNANGQLGDGTTTDRHSPVKVDLTGGARKIAAGGSHSLVELIDGTLVGWGDNSRGQLEVGLAARVTVPQVLAVGPGRSFSGGTLHSLSVRNGEMIGVWGDPRAAATARVSTTGENSTEGSRFVSATSGAAAFHNLAIVARPSQVGVPAPALAAWRELHFGTAANEGEAADCYDCDHDGIPNLVEYAFGLDPNADSSGQLPQPQRVGNHFELRFSRALTKPDIEIGAEWSPDLQPGSWQPVPDSGDATEALFALPLNTAPRLFMRMTVKAKPEM